MLIGSHDLRHASQDDSCRPLGLCRNRNGHTHKIVESPAAATSDVKLLVGFQQNSFTRLIITLFYLSTENLTFRY